jgi:hypothetical protein
MKLSRAFVNHCEATRGWWWASPAERRRRLRDVRKRKLLSKISDPTEARVALEVEEALA